MQTKKKQFNIFQGCLHRAGIAQLGERQTEDLKVACSIHAHRIILYFNSNNLLLHVSPYLLQIYAQSLFFILTHSLFCSLILNSGNLLLHVSPYLLQIYAQSLFFILAHSLFCSLK